MFRRKYFKIWKFVAGRCSKYSTESVVNMDKLETVRLVLSERSGSFVNLHYYDSSPGGKSPMPTILASHGNPGSHKDFKYMVPILVSQGYRVIAPNWPGLGVTDDPPEDEFSHTNSERAQLLTSFLKALNVQKIDVAVGHSAGCYPYPLFFSDNPGLCSTAVFIAPGGATPHKSIRPYWFLQLLERLLRTPLYPLVSRFIFLFTTRVLLQKIANHSHAAVSLRIIGNLDFFRLSAALLALKAKKNPPIVLVCGKEDHLVEKEKSIEFAEKLGCHEHDGIFHIENSDAIDGTIEKILSNSGDRLDRHYAILFEHGSHFLQKHEAESICKLIKAIIR